MQTEPSLKTVVYNAVLESILNHEYKANQIISEKELIQKYGHSKSPVREALVTLCNEGVLRNIPRCGYEVVGLTMSDVRDILQFRYFIESGAIQSCYKKMSPKQIAVLRGINEKCQKTQEDSWSHWKYNTEFHLKLISYTRNDYLYQELERSMSRLKRAYAQFYWEDWNEERTLFDTRSHEPLLACLEAGDIQRVLEELRNDLNDFAGVNRSIDFGV